MTAVIGPSFQVKGIDPPAVRSAPRDRRRAFWQAVAGYVIEAKDLELRQGLDKDGQPLAPLSEKTIKNRHSAMGPADPNAPPLQPAHGLSRTRSLFTVEVNGTATGVVCWWLYDEHTGDSWGEILEHHRQGAGNLPVRDVIGLSPRSLAMVKRRAAAWWEASEIGLTLEVRPQREILPTPAPRFMVERVKRYEPKSFKRPTKGKLVKALKINGHVYTLQSGSASLLRESIARGTFGGFKGKAEAFASLAKAGVRRGPGGEFIFGQ